jgi:signal transduction histidine kinase
MFLRRLLFDLQASHARPAHCRERTYARAISTSAKILLPLIDEVLDFSKIEAGKVELRAAPFEVADAAQSVVELLAPPGRDKRFEVGSVAPRDLLRTVIGDGMRVRQILMNLMGNAIKFTERGRRRTDSRARARLRATDSRRLPMHVTLHGA